jgi:hypothetical protein
VTLLLLGPPFSKIFLFLSTTLLTVRTGFSLHVQWPQTSQLQGSFLIENNWFIVSDQTAFMTFFFLRIGLKLHTCIDDYGTITAEIKLLVKKKNRKNGRLKRKR